MKFKVGDKVKFLNEKGGGVVSKILNPGMVSVAIEDGFEIPVLVGELIKIEFEAPADSPKHFFREDFNINIEPGDTSDIASDRNIRLHSHPAKGETENGIYLAFVPKDQKWLITGILDIFLVNHTSFDILFSLFLQNPTGGFSGFDYGSVEPESMVLVDSIERDKLNNWLKGIVQVLYHQEYNRIVFAPGNSDFLIKPARFFKETSYSSSSLIPDKSILYSLLPASAQSPLFTSAEEKRNPPADTFVIQAKPSEPQHVIDKHKTSPREAVVDLHIEELSSDHRGMENAEILRLQVNYFTRCLESAIVNNLSKVNFIHGVGTGVLKTALKEILKDYPNVEYRDASIQKFGYGATEVIIRQVPEK
jgi:hypothetical protein